MFSAPIPQDIISLIIEQHLFNDMSTLKACSLVSRSFVAPSRKGLFHTIHLRDSLKAQQRCQKLHRVFLANPELLTYVRELYVMDSGWGLSGVELQGLDLLTHWASKEESLHAILNMLPLLRLFSFMFTDDIFSPNEWKSISVELKLALLRVFTLPSLRICILEGVDNLPGDFFSSFEHLKKLSLADVSIAQDPLGLSAPSVSMKKVQLESLGLKNIKDSSTLFEAMRASVDLSQLRDVSVYPGSPNVVWEATKDSIGTLEMLTWDHYIGDG
jgi:hypothetical protein